MSSSDDFLYMEASISDYLKIAKDHFKAMNNYRYCYPKNGESNLNLYWTFHEVIRFWYIFGKNQG